MTVPNPGAFAAPAQQQQLAPGYPVQPGLAPPAPRKPPLTPSAAHRARLAGGVGGGVAWLGLGIAQTCAGLLMLAVGAAAVLLGVVLAFSGGAPEARGEVWPELLQWLGSPTAIALMIGIPVGLAIALLGLWISARLLRHPGIARPVGVTWAAFGISIVAGGVVGGVGGAVLTPIIGALPDLGVDLGSAQLAALDRLVGAALPYAVAVGVVSLLLQTAVSVFAWWWMAHAMRPAAEVERPA
ncbi:MAG: hypothetical protein ACQEWM_03540 [Actinomycetota bacterium]